jgi:hypothetical protein
MVTLMTLSKSTSPGFGMVMLKSPGPTERANSVLTQKNRQLTSFVTPCKDLGDLLCSGARRASQFDLKLIRNNATSNTRTHRLVF